MTRPIEQETIDAIAQLHGEGYSRNEIAKRLDIGMATVTKYARDMGLAFDHSKTALAVDALRIDLAKASTELAQRMVDRAFYALEQFDAPALIVKFEGSKYVEAGVGEDKDRHFVEGGFREHVLPTPTIGDQQRIMTTAAIAFDKARRIVDVAGSDREKSLGLLDSFGKVLERAVEEYEREAGETSDTAYPPADDVHPR